jgi:hypothetical protein
MSHYSLVVWSERTRVRYPRTFDLPNVDAARAVALKIAHIFREVVPYWGNLSSKQRDNFVVEILDEAGQTVLTVPFREAEEPKS